MVVDEEGGKDALKGLDRVDRGDDGALARRLQDDDQFAGERMTTPAAQGEVHIASIVVHVRPERIDAVAELASQLGAEVSGTDPSGKLVIVLESPSERSIVAAIDAIQALEGVFAALLVYHHAEPASALEECHP